MKKSIIFLVFAISPIFALSQTQFNRILYDSVRSGLITDIMPIDCASFVAMFVHRNDYDMEL